MTTRRYDNVSNASFEGTDSTTRVHFRTDWSRATRRLIVGAMCVITASTLAAPATAYAAEQITVGSDTYLAGAEAGDGSTWRWDGADNMELKNYNGAGITAQGKLNVTYEGENTVSADGTDSAISAVTGMVEAGELTITGGSGDTLNATAENADAIYGESGVEISGEGTVSATNVNGFYEGPDGSYHSGVAIGSGGDIAISGPGSVNAEAGAGAAVRADGAVSISGGASVDVNAAGDAITASSGVSVTGSALTGHTNAHGVYSEGDITIDSSTVKLVSSGGDADTLFTLGGNVFIKNASNVDLEAEGMFSYAIAAFGDSSMPNGGKVFITDSTLKAIARYASPGSGDITITSDDPGATFPGCRAYAVYAQTGKGIEPATIFIGNSNVTAEGDTAAIVAVVVNGDGTAVGTVSISGGTVTTPAGGGIGDYLIPADEYNPSVTAGQFVGVAGSTVDNLLDRAVAKSVVIVQSDENAGGIGGGAEENPKKDPVQPEAPARPAKPATTQAKATTTKLPATGDASGMGIVALGFSGLIALVSGLFVDRRRD